MTTRGCGRPATVDVVRRGSVSTIGVSSSGLRHGCCYGAIELARLPCQVATFATAFEHGRYGDNVGAMVNHMGVNRSELVSRYEAVKVLKSDEAYLGADPAPWGEGSAVTFVRN